MKKARMPDIDRAKGFGIFLVVLGHIVARDFPADNQWFEVVKMTIYKFHMPFFMFLTGLVAAYSYKPISSTDEYTSYVSKKAERLLPAYFLFLIIVFACKSAAQPFLHVDNPTQGIQDIFHALIYPKTGVVGFLWFIWVAFLLYSITPILLRIVNNNITVALLIAFSVQFIKLPELFGVNLVGEYLFYFIAGFFVIKNKESYDAITSRFCIIFVVAFLLALYIPDIPKTVTGILSIPAIHFFVKTLASDGMIGRWLDMLGKYTFPIYLMNTLAIGLTKAIILEFHPWDGLAFLFIAPVLLISGIAIPIAVKLYLFSRISFLNKITN